MSSAGVICFASFVYLTAAAGGTDSVHALSVTASGNLKNKVVRRVRTSIFGGLLRTDRYAFHRGLNCSSGNGGESLAETTHLSLGECQKSCANDDGCTCVSFAPSSGTCSKQRYCHLEDCVASSLVDTYALHTTLKVPQIQRGSRQGLDSQASFERSGGRDCSSATTLQSFNVGTALDVQLSVTQCLTHCSQNANCTCVKYERYYQSECFLMTGCEHPTFCSRSNKYDMYVMPTTAATPAPTNSPTQANCFGQANFVNFDWGSNNTCSNQPCSHYNTKDPYYAYCKKMACANTQRDAWCAAGGTSACRNECGRCSAAEQADCL